MKKTQILIFGFLLLAFNSKSQNVVWPSISIQELTPDWTGERTPDGRPKVSDQLLERLKALSMEEVWASLRRSGYQNQFENFASTFENGWQILHPEKAMTGRVVTAQFMPLRKDFDNYVQQQAEKEGTKTPVTNYAPIIKLSDGDVYVADSYGKMVEGTLIGDNLGNAIYNAGKRGVIFNGSVRDVEGLSKIEGFNAWIRGSDPSAISQMMIASINGPIRIGRVTVLPGDVVLAKRTGVAFIPLHLVQGVVLSGEYTALSDEYSRFCMKTKKYEYINEAFVVDDDVFEKDFQQWLDAYPNLPMSRKELTDFIEEREARRKAREANQEH
jgi:regulator of RNase E activity RraA